MFKEQMSLLFILVNGDYYLAQPSFQFFYFLRKSKKTLKKNDFYSSFLLYLFFIRLSCFIFFLFVFLALSFF